MRITPEGNQGQNTQKVQRSAWGASLGPSHRAQCAIYDDGDIDLQELDNGGDGCHRQHDDEESQ
jgi:hypothetical protein